MSERIWTDDQVASLRGYQKSGFMHPFTCEAGTDLIPTPAGWVEVEGGPVVQTWAHDFMLNWAWRGMSPFGLDGLFSGEGDEEA